MDGGKEINGLAGGLGSTGYRPIDLQLQVRLFELRRQSRQVCEYAKEMRRELTEAERNVIEDARTYLEITEKNSDYWKQYA